MIIGYTLESGVPVKYDTKRDRVTLTLPMGGATLHYDFDRHDLYSVLKAIEVEALKAGHRPVLAGEQR